MQKQTAVSLLQKHIAKLPDIFNTVEYQKTSSNTAGTPKAAKMNC